MTPSLEPAATRSFRATLALLALLTIIAGLPALRGEWILDDGPLIASNPAVKQLTADNVRRLLTQSMWDLDLSAAQLRPYLSYYRPLVMLSYALDWQWSGGDPVAFHVTNLLLHALTVFLAGRALWRWTGSSVGSLLGAAYFGLHPARAESVAWISGRPDVLATLGMLLAVEGVALLRGSRRGLAVALLALGALIGFASKETMLLLPVLVAIELGTAGKLRVSVASLRSAWPVWGSALLATSYLAARQIWLPMRSEPIRGLGALTHVGFVLETLGRGALYLLAPFDLSISSPILTERGGHVAPAAAYVWLGGAVSLLLGLALFWTWRRRQSAFWALGAFLVSLVPVLNVVWIGGIGLTSPRFFYLPSLLVAWAAIELLKGRFQTLASPMAAVVGGAFTLTLAALLALQSSVYASRLAFWSSELRSRPDVPGNIEYFVDRDWRDGEPERALARSVCAYRIAQERFSFRGEGASIISKALEQWSARIPDADRAQLTAIADFLAATRRPEGKAVLGLDLSIEIPPGGKVRNQLQRFAAPSLTQEAELRVRTGERERAIELVHAARASCPRCGDLLDRQARVVYRAFDPELAARLAAATSSDDWGGAPKMVMIARLRSHNDAIAKASGLERTQLEVQRAAELGLPAEALRLLDGVPTDPGVLRLRLRFAALAGDVAAAARTARELGTVAPPSPAGISSERTKHYLTQLKDGCAYPEELE